MPIIALKAKCLRTKVKNLLFITCFLSLALILSGCTAIGIEKPAALQVTAKPEASVFLDGKHLGKTPFYSDQLKAGEYLLKITASDASYVERISLEGGTLTVVNRLLNNNFMAASGETLRLESQGKGLFVVSMPSEASLVVDGKLMGKTPILIEEINQGDHKVELSKDGYDKLEFAIKTSDKYQLVADATLASEMAKSQAASGPSPAPTEELEIIQTPQGFLRVRQDPSQTAQEIGQVKTGDQVEVIQYSEKRDWVQVKFEDSSGATKQGWISIQYTKKL